MPVMLITMITMLIRMRMRIDDAMMITRKRAQIQFRYVFCEYCCNCLASAA